MWTDVPKKRKRVKGKWTIKSNLLILKKNKKEHFSFLCYRHSWTIFLIPTTKNREFNIQLDKNKTHISNLSESVKTMPGYALDDSLSYLKYLCFYRIPEK